MSIPDDTSERSPIIIEDDALRGGFTQIPNSILKRTDISTGAKLTYMGLLSFAWQGDRCFPGQPRLAEEIGVSPRAVWTHLQQLEEQGLIAIKQRGQGKTNIYTILRIAESASLESHTSARQESQNLRGNNTQLKDPEKKMQPSSIRVAAHADFAQADPSETPTDNRAAKSAQRTTERAAVNQPPRRSAMPVRAVPPFAEAHPGLVEAGCASKAEFIRVVGSGLWNDEAMNIERWHAHRLDLRPDQRATGRRR